MDIPIIFEDENYIVLNKPAGLVVHTDGRTQEFSVTMWLMEKYPKQLGVGGVFELRDQKMSVPRCGVVHRIDRDTSGALLVAKNQPAFDLLQEQFNTRTIYKCYHAFVYGPLPKDEDVIVLPIGRSSTDPRRWSAERGARGTMREAVTAYKVLNKSKQYSFVEVEPKTGRTHQIRVHFKAIQHPVICDPFYAPNLPPALGFERLALHARILGWQGIDGEAHRIEAPYPADFIAAEATLKANIAKE